MVRNAYTMELQKFLVKCKWGVCKLRYCRVMSVVGIECARRCRYHSSSTNSKPTLSRIVVESCQIAFKCRHLGFQYRLRVCQPYKVDNVIRVGEERRYSKAFRARGNQCDLPVASLKSLTTSKHLLLSLRRWLCVPRMRGEGVDKNFPVDIRPVRSWFLFLLVTCWGHCGQ